MRTHCQHYSLAHSRHVAKQIVTIIATTHSMTGNFGSLENAATHLRVAKICGRPGKKSSPRRAQFKEDEPCVNVHSKIVPSIPILL